MRDGAERIRTEEMRVVVVVVGGFRRTTLKRKNARRESDGDIGSRGGRQGEHRGDEKKEQGIWQAAIKRGRRERKKDSVVDETGLTELKGERVF